MALDYLPSPGWAVIYGETPSATRWSELGDNDDALATGAGIDDLAILTRHIAALGITAPKIAGLPGSKQENTTNSAATKLRIEVGSGLIVGAAASEISKTVTFSTAFASRPYVVANAIGYKAGGGGIYDPTSVANDWGGQAASAVKPTTTTTVIRMRRIDGAAYTTGTDYYFNWIAIGEA